MALSQKYKAFADEYIRTGDQTKAYLKAYPKVKPNSARVKSYTLLQNVTVQAYIKEIQDKINAKVNEKLTTEMAEGKWTNLLDTLEKRDICAKIARGELVYQKEIIDKKGVKHLISIEPDFNDRLKAAELDSKLKGDFAPTKSDINLKADVHELIKTGNLMLDSGKEPEGKEPKPLK